MTLPMTITSICSVRGAVSNQLRLASTNAFGSPDLDLRPPEMKRSTMWAWLEECPECGYVASSLSKACPVPRSFLQSEDYQRCEGLTFRSRLAKRFYRAYMLQRRAGALHSAMRHALETAWLCDDSGETDNAIRCRNLAADCLQFLRQVSPDDETLMVQQLDILRRAGRFEEALAAYEQLDLENLSELIRKLAAFEAKKAQQHDMSCYTVAMAVEDV